MYNTFNASFKVAGTKTFRLASAQLLRTTEQAGYGNNMQNIPDDARRCFVPRPGNMYTNADLESAEAVAVALLVREGNFRDLIRHKIKPHNFMCVALFPALFNDLLPEDFSKTMTPNAFAVHPQYKAIVSRCKKLPREYSCAKTTVHSANYSAGPKTLRDNVLKGTQGAVVISIAEAKRLLDVYFTLFGEIREYQKLIDQLVKEHKPVYNLFGHAAQFIGRYTTGLARTVISWAPQSTIGQANNIAYNRLQDEIEDRGLRRFHLGPPVHDSILMEHPIEDAADARDMMRRNMSFTFNSPIDNWQCTIGVETAQGMNWGKYDETDNPNGLQVITE